MGKIRWISKFYGCLKRIYGKNRLIMEGRRSTITCPICGNEITEYPRKVKYPRYHVYHCDVCGITIETERTPDEKKEQA